jgi:hypothetical protein
MGTIPIITTRSPSWRTNITSSAGRADGNHEGDWHKAEQEFRKMHQERSTVVGHVA